MSSWAWCSVVVKALHYKSDGSRDRFPGGVTGDFFCGSPRRNHVPWGRHSLWKWVPGISPGVKAAGAYGWRPIVLVVPNVKKIWGLNLPGTPWATSACCGMTFTFTFNNECETDFVPSLLLSLSLLLIISTFVFTLNVLSFLCFFSFNVEFIVWF